MPNLPPSPHLDPADPVPGGPRPLPGPDDVVLREATAADTPVLDTFGSRAVRGEHDWYDDDDLADAHRGRSARAPG